MKMLNEKEFLGIIEQGLTSLIEKEFDKALKGGETPLLQLLEKSLNRVMIAERKDFLKQNNDVGNGYYKRALTTSMGKLNLKVPRTRESNFRSLFLPEHYVRVEQSYDDLLKALITTGYSDSKLRNIISSLGISYSENTIEKITNELKDEYYNFVRREIDENVFVIYIDGKKTKLKKKETARVENITIYTVIGINFEWKKDIYGFYIFEGNENKRSWIEVFNDLISRGMKKVDIIVSDDFPGIDDAINDIFPLSSHQLCITHLKRNIQKHMKRDDANDFKNVFDSIKNMKNYDKALDKFQRLLIQYKDKYKTFIPYLWKKRKLYLNFIKYPQNVRKYIYTTNIAENFNRRIETIRVRLSGYFQSEEVLGINIILQLKYLKNSKWKIPHPILKGSEYELLQIHNLNFADADFNNTDINEAFSQMNDFSKNIIKQNEVTL